MKAILRLFSSERNKYISSFELERETLLHECLSKLCMKSGMEV